LQRRRATKRGVVGDFHPGESFDLGRTSRRSSAGIDGLREFAMAGGLMSYGASLVDYFRQLGIYAGKILNGPMPTICLFSSRRKFRW
jgi:hypothetical protein